MDIEAIAVHRAGGIMLGNEVHHRPDHQRERRPRSRHFCSGPPSRFYRRSPIELLGATAQRLSEVNGKTYGMDGGDFCEFIEVEGPIRPAVFAEVDAVRSLLHRLNLSLVLCWQPNGKRYYQLTRATVKAEFGENDLNFEDTQEIVTCPPTNTNVTRAAMRLRSFSRSRPLL